VSADLVGPFPDGVDPDDYDRLRRRVLWSFPTGLFVIGTTALIDGQRVHNLMTANLVVQVATRPKLVAVALETEAVTARLARAGRCFSVSLLARSDRAVVRRFAKPVKDVTLDEAGRPVAMAGEPVEVARTGAPILAGALAWVDCRLHSLDELGSHVLVIGEVLGVGGPPGEDGAEVLRMEDTKMHYGG
jgi:flavin reductase (DIM6/NTAB) family NADH-FMN oxidoreductase RutF